MDISFILVEPSNSGNIGASARAIKTMGFKKLILINPCEYLTEESKKLAYGSHDILESVSVFGSLEDAKKEIDYLIGTTAKKRTYWSDYFTPNAATMLIKEKGDAIKSLGIVFGREDTGLTTAELEYCDLISMIEMESRYPSINLSQAVMIYSFCFSKINLESDSIQMKKGSKAISREISQSRLKEKATEIFDKIGIGDHPVLKRRMLERLMQANSDDTKLFLSLYSHLSRHI